MKEKKIIILLAGPTASGKSDLAIKLAQNFDGEIINADSMQVYKEVSILTSKPKSEDLKIVKHHLYGFNSVKDNFSTGHWIKMAENEIKKQWKNKKIPIVVGGTGLYFKSLTDGLSKIPEIPENFRKKVRNLYNKLGQNKFYNLLIQLDPLAKKFILKSDSQRSIRAYEVKKFTTKSLFEFIKKTESKFHNNVFKKLFINTPRSILNKKIERRVEEMFMRGAIEEANFFFEMNVDKDLPSNKILGLREIKDYLEGKISLDKTKELINQKTRQYAKRQFTWARGHMKSWNMIYSSNISDLYKKAINKIS